MFPNKTTKLGSIIAKNAFAWTQRNCIETNGQNSKLFCEGENNPIRFKYLNMEKQDPYCMAFVVRVLEDSFNEIEKDYPYLKTASVKAWYNAYVKKNELVSGTKETIIPGAVFTRKDLHHTGIILGRDYNFVYTAEGNTTVSKKQGILIQKKSIDKFLNEENICHPEFNGVNPEYVDLNAVCLQTEGYIWKQSNTTGSDKKVFKRNFFKSREPK